jgi:muramoyltetrapeptide carboxypeptidase LdcA involved in peptidoglycan recycling
MISGQRIIISIVLLICIVKCQFPTPKPLKPGDPVIIIAPAGALGPTERSNLNLAIEKVIKGRWKLDVTLGKHIFENTTRQGGFAGWKR